MSFSRIAAATLVIFAASANAQWKYEFDKNSMTDEFDKFATVSSINSHNLSFPYHGGTTGKLMVRERESQLNIMFLINRGQLICSNYSSCSITARFDDGEVQEFDAGRASDGSSNVLFIHDEDSFVEKLKSSKRLRLQALFYQQGNLMFDFKTTGLKWPPEPPTAPRKAKK